MSAPNDGGPAFPVWELNGHGKPEMTDFGMTLRDYFAAKAMQSLIAGHFLRREPRDYLVVGVIEASAYTVADAMLKAREVKP